MQWLAATGLLILQCLIAILGYILSLNSIFGKKKTQKRLILFFAILGIIAAILVTIGTHFIELSKDREAQSNVKLLQDQGVMQRIKLDSISSQNDSLQIELKRIHGKVDTIVRLCQKFRYPGLNEDQVLSKLILDISEISRKTDLIVPKLIFVAGRGENFQDEKTRYWHKVLIFKSSVAAPLQSVSIWLRFNDSILSATIFNPGEFGIGPDPTISVAPDMTSISGHMDYLHETSELRIEIISERPIEILESRLSP